MRRALLILLCIGMLMGFTVLAEQGGAGLDEGGIVETTPRPTPRMIVSPRPTASAGPVSPTPAAADIASAEPTVGQDAQSVKSEYQTFSPGALRSATVAVQPSPSPALARLMADTQGETILAVGGLFSGGSTVLGSDIPRSAVTAVRFGSSLAGAPADAWDVSEAHDGGVLAWLDSDGVLTIAGNGGVRANADCSHLFAGYASVTRIDFNGCFFTDEVLDMSHMFESCWSLTSLDVSSLDTSNVTDMSYMFSTCPALAQLDLSGFDTRNVKSMEGMFLMDESLGSLDLSGIDASGVINLSSMFQGCAGLQTLDLSNMQLNSATYIGGMFSDCTSLSEVNFGKGLRAVPADAADAFRNCPAVVIVDGSELNALAWSKLADYAALTPGSSGDDVLWLQQKLHDAGCYQGVMDGTFGDDTEAALRLWQRTRGYVVTGRLDAAQVRTLIKQG